MKPSSRTKYALETLVDLALNRKDGVASVTDIAQRQHIPAKFLEQILLSLKAGGLVLSRRGARGGYILAREPSAISVGDVVRLTETSFASTRQAPGRIDPLGEIWDDIGSYASKKLASITLQDVCARTIELKRSNSSEYEI